MANFFRGYYKRDREWQQKQQYKVLYEAIDTASLLKIMSRRSKSDSDRRRCNCCCSSSLYSICMNLFGFKMRRQDCCQEISENLEEL